MIPVPARAKEIYAEYLSARERLGRKKDVCLMDLATMYPREVRDSLADLDISEEINACSIKHKVKTSDGERDYLIMFKNETHNHPTEIEPFGGAATCLGGAIRDPAFRKKLRIPGNARDRSGRPEGKPCGHHGIYKLPQRKITREAAGGYSSYGNQIGLATGLVHEVYHPGYKAKRMEIGAVIGAAPAENIVRERPQKGDIIVLIGGATGQGRLRRRNRFFQGAR